MRVSCVLPNYILTHVFQFCDIVRREKKMTDDIYICFFSPQSSFATLEFLKKNCHTIDHMTRNFIWKVTSITGIYLVYRKKNARPKKFGGLGFDQLNTKMVLLGKLIWNMLRNTYKFWVCLLSHKYLSAASILPIYANMDNSI